MDSAETARRVRAARALAKPSPEEVEAREQYRVWRKSMGKGAKRSEPGISVDELADRIRRRRYTFGSIGDIEREARDADPGELWVIAETCGLPRAFFSIDFARLTELDEEARQLARGAQALGREGSSRLARLKRRSGSEEESAEEPNSTAST